jgi:conjugative transfer signal peptidase TraF
MVERRDLPLLRWGEDLRRIRARRQRLAVRCAFGFVFMAALAATVVNPPRPRLVWNVSPSAPVGLYWVSSAAGAGPGDMVIAWLPQAWRPLAAARHYVPSNVPLVKRVAAGPGDRICALGGQVYVNGRWAAWRLPVDARGRSMPGWEGCRILADRALFLLMDRRDSFDGRYFGPTDRSDIVGRATLLWAR